MVPVLSVNVEYRHLKNDRRVNVKLALTRGRGSVALVCISVYGSFAGNVYVLCNFVSNCSGLTVDHGKRSRGHCR
jgi:hypothetical protein